MRHYSHLLQTRSSQRGVTLAVVLILLVVVLLIAISAARFTALGSRSGFSESQRLTAFQNAQSIGEAVIGDYAGLSFSGVANDIVGCYLASGVTLPPAYIPASNISNACPSTAQAIVPPTSLPANVSPSLVLFRRLPDTLAPRTLGTSAVYFDAIGMEVVTGYDQTNNGEGTATIYQGVLTLVPKN